MKLSKEVYQGEFLVSFVVTVIQIIHESEQANLTTKIFIGSNKMLLENNYENLKFVYFVEYRTGKYSKYPFKSGSLKRVVFFNCVFQTH